MLIFEACSVQDKILQERDFVNVQRFLDVALEYETTYQSELPTLQGFLRYCEENRDQEMLQQLDVESSSAIQLLTIHKSKGLEFDSVFVWWNLKGISDKENTQLKKYEIYADAGFKHLRDYALTLHYHKVLSASSFSEITLQEKQRSELEELNNLYVALTRAKSRLHLFVAFFKKDGWDAYWKDYEKADKLTPPHYAVAAALAYLQTHATLQDDSSYLIGTLPGQERELPSGSPLPQDLSCTPEHVPQDLSCEANPVQHDLSCTPEHVPQDLSCEANPVLQDLSCRPSILQEKSCSTYHPFWQAILPDWQQPDSLPASGLQPNPDIDFKQTYLLDRAALKGSVAHYYLSYIKYNKPDEQSVARLRTLRQFGNLLRKADLEAIIAKVDAQLPRMSTIFDPAYDLILTEYTVFQKGKEYRIDRLMLNSQAKTYCIIDFKTGGIHEPDQIALYGRIMASLLDHLGWKPESPQYLIFKL
jgi:ATP-dependent exoDNAse (exonuclease V) beta subunit